MKYRSIVRRGFTAVVGCVLSISFMAGISPSASAAESEFYISPTTIATTEGGNPATFYAGPKGEPGPKDSNGQYAGTRVMVRMWSEGYTDLGFGVGVPRYLTCDYLNDSWYCDGKPAANGLAITVGAYNDTVNQGAHIDKIRFEITGDTNAEYFKTMDMVRDGRMVINNITDNDAPTSPPVDQPQPLQPPTSDPEPQIMKPLLNDMAGYTEGTLDPQWLKPDEGVRFNVESDGVIQEHTVTVKELGDDYAIIELASDPLEASIHVGQTQFFDVNGDGANDISITLVGIGEGQAGLSVKPLSDEAKTEITTAAVQETKPNNASKYFAIATLIAIIITLLCIFIYKRRHPAAERTQPSKTTPLKK